jgi:hypothetical protein
LLVIDKKQKVNQVLLQDLLKKREKLHDVELAVYGV